MTEPFTLTKQRPGKVDGGGDRLQIGQRVTVIQLMPSLLERTSEKEIEFIVNRHGTVIALEPNGVPTFKMDGGALVSGSETRWVRDSHV